MANITEEHLQHMARRHHATMQKLDGIRDKIALYSHKSFSLAETGFGAWAGGILEGRTGGGALGPVPLNLGIGIAMAAAGAIMGARKSEVTVTREVSPGVATVTARRIDYGEHLTNLGNGLIGSWFAAAGYAFGKRWKETGKVFGGGGRPWTHPYENGWPKPPAEGPAAPPTAAGWYDMAGG